MLSPFTNQINLVFGWKVASQLLHYIEREDLEGRRGREREREVRGREGEKERRREGERGWKRKSVCERGKSECERGKSE